MHDPATRAPRANTPTTTDCASDQRLTLLQLGELSPTEAEQLAAHLAGCPRCARAQATLEANVASFEATRPAQWARLLQQLPPAPALASPSDGPRRRARSRWLLPALAAAALIAAGLLVALVGPFGGPPAPDVRFKGSLGIEIVAKRKEIQFAVGQQTVVQPGDALRFIVTTEVPGYLSVFSVDGTGRVSPFYPATPPQRAPAGLRIEQAGQRVLPGSIILDDAPGPERIVVAFSARPLHRVRLHHRLRRCLHDVEGAPARAIAERCTQRGTVIEVFVLAKHRIDRGLR